MEIAKSAATTSPTLAKVPRVLLGSLSLAIASALEQGPMNGYDLMKHTRSKSGSVYAALARLDASGCIQSTEPPPGYKPKGPTPTFYKLTEAGKALTRERLARLNLAVRPAG